MRLINADSIKWDIGTVWPDKGTRVVPYSDIEKADTVEAIPVEWIAQWLLKNCYDENGHYIGDGYDTVEDMLEDWRKEQNEG